MPLLFLAQRATGTISVQAMEEIADICGISATDVASVVGFLHLFHDEAEAGGAYPHPGLLGSAVRPRGAKASSPSVRSPGHSARRTTPDGLITGRRSSAWQPATGAHVPAARDGEITYHENQTVDLALATGGNPAQPSAGWLRETANYDRISSFAPSLHSRHRQPGSLPGNWRI